MREQKLKYSDIVKKFRATKVLVVGDIMLDLYIRGDVERISPEAPVPIIFETSREYTLGGAGNVSANLAALGGQVTLIGIVGNDVEGEMVERVSRKAGITPRFVRISRHPTTVKMRAVSGSHQLARVDREHMGALTKNVEEKVKRAIQSGGEYDIVMISDYAKGFVTQAVIDALKKRFGGKKIIANIKPLAHHKRLFQGIDINFYKGIKVMTMNANEGAFYTGIDTSHDKGAADAARRLGRKLQASIVLTRGAHGLMAHDHAKKMTVHVQNRPLNVFDVTGAGDTVVATLALMLGAGTPLFEAAEVANHAGGVVVGRRGTAVISPPDLKPFLQSA